LSAHKESMHLQSQIANLKSEIGCPLEFTGICFPLAILFKKVLNFF
jgi:hypothetical protein